jgi:hypothetical protein
VCVCVCVCVCRLSYPACNAHAPYYIVIFGLAGSTKTGHSRKDGARPALFLIFCVVLGIFVLYVLFVL